MFAIIGILVVFGAVVGGYLMEHGNLRVLLQPAELLIIGGAAGGTVLIANPLHILKQIAGGITGVFTGSKFTKKRYLDSLKTLYDLLNKARREGLMALESDVEEPSKSPILSKNPAFLADHHVRDFFCDSMRMAITGTERPTWINFWNSTWTCITIRPVFRSHPSAPWQIPCPGWASWLPCSES